MSFTVRGPSFSYGSIGRQSSPTVARIPRRRPPGATGTAVLRLGKTGDFQFTEALGGFKTQPILPPNLPEGYEPEGDDAALGLIFTETVRKTTTVRISNPLDATDFVDVERIDQISFLGPDGRIRTFILNN